MIGRLLPPEVVAEEAFGDLPDIVSFPDEEAVIANAVDKRRREVTTGRSTRSTDCRRRIIPATRPRPRCRPHGHVSAQTREPNIGKQQVSVTG